MLILLAGCVGLFSGKSVSVDPGKGKILEPMELVQITPHVFKAVSPLSKQKKLSIAKSKPDLTSSMTAAESVEVKPIVIPSAPTTSFKPTVSVATNITVRPVPITIPPVVGEVLEVTEIIVEPIELPQPVQVHAWRLIMYYVLALITICGVYFGWLRYKKHKASAKPKRKRTTRKRKS
jgi:hypothetical protein